MRHRFALGGGLYSDTRHSPAHVWPLSQALAASLVIDSLPSERAAARADALQTVQALARYRIGQAYSGEARPPLDRGGNVYYDDNNWIALDLLASYRLLGERVLLRRAEGVFRFLVSGWDSHARDGCPGGVFWAKRPLGQIRTTVSTANAAVVALRIYQATGTSSYLTWGKRMYGWVSRCLAAPNSLYFGNLNRFGHVVRREWAYNQGAMIAAGVLLAQATGKHSYLEKAEATAKAALAYYRASRYKGEPASYVAIFFGDLRLLQQVGGSGSYSNALHQYLRRHVKLRADGHFGFSLLYQAAAVQLYSFAARTS